jgi:hypothetical protein
VEEEEETKTFGGVIEEEEVDKEGTQILTGGDDGV